MPFKPTQNYPPDQFLLNCAFAFDNNAPLLLYNKSYIDLIWSLRVVRGDFSVGTG